ncbi:unnamed protein product [Allacma fusca]|uniref:Uncharacterized protein n=1 Tax=Allacma fusca TaxID=39272 RepID=A0A8J2JFD0_9HEXA|nr:unnamed protein product [Allacma fusca]
MRSPAKFVFACVFLLLVCNTGSFKLFPSLSKIFIPTSNHVIPASSGGRCESGKILNGICQIGRFFG